MDAIKLSEQNAFDLIRLDVQMPELDGIQATAAAVQFRNIRRPCHEVCRVNYIVIQVTKPEIISVHGSRW